jgi:hypothetical protein
MILRLLRPPAAADDLGKQAPGVDDAARRLTLAPLSAPERADFAQLLTRILGHR